MNATKDLQKRKEEEERKRRRELEKERREKAKKEKEAHRKALLDLGGKGAQKGVMDNLLDALNSGRAFQTGIPD